VKTAGSNAHPLPRGTAMAVITGVLFQGRGLPRCCVKAVFRESGRGVGTGPQGPGGSAYPLEVSKRANLAGSWTATSWPGWITNHSGTNGGRYHKSCIRLQVAYDSM